jgi:hypothetical protein
MARVLPSAYNPGSVTLINESVLEGGFMRIAVMLITIGAAFPFIARAALCQDSETVIERRQLPAAVERTVAAQSAGATIKGFSREIEGGKTFYEVELVVNGKSRDVLMDAGGGVVEVEEQVVLDELPAAVREALLAKAGPGQITTVESLTKRGRLVAYEGHVKNGQRRSEIQVGPEGETLHHEE